MPKASEQGKFLSGNAHVTVFVVLNNGYLTGLYGKVREFLDARFPKAGKKRLNL